MNTNQSQGKNLVPLNPQSNYFDVKAIFQSVLPVLENDIEIGGIVPDRMPALRIEDIDEDPVEAARIIEDYNRNMPKYLQNPNRKPIFTKQDEWEEEPMSTEMRIIGKKRDNTTPQIVDGIRRIAGRGSRFSTPVMGSGIANIKSEVVEVPFTEKQGQELKKALENE